MTTFEQLNKLLSEDRHYAETWHCNLSCVMQDGGVNYNLANKLSSMIMKSFFDVDTTDLWKHK